MDSAKSVNRHTHITIILLSVLVGAVLAGMVFYYPQTQSTAVAQDEATPMALNQALALENAFVAIADKALPTVVSIDVETQGTSGNMGDLEEFFKDNPFFGPYFRDREGQEGKEKTPQRAPRGRSMGSGWIYSEDGLIVTNSHVVRGSDKITVRLHDKEGDDRDYPAKLIGTDPKTELAVIKVDAGRKLPFIELGDSSAVRVGQWVMAVGAPFQLEQTVTVGVVSAKGRFLPGQDPRYIRIGDIIQTDAAINPGNSGGPLLNLKGQVVGINVAIMSSSMAQGNVGIGFAIPADTAKRIIPDLVENKRVARGWLGVSISELAENDRDFFGAAEGGVLVEDITEGGPAAKSDLQMQDVIVAVNGEKVASTWDLQKAVAASAPGVDVVMDVIREKKPVQVKVKLGEMPAKYTGLEEVAEEPEQEQISALGVSVAPLTGDDAKQLGLPAGAGLIVTQVAPDGPAANKLIQGDVITALNRDKVTNTKQYQAALDKAKQSGQGYVMVFFSRRADEQWSKQHEDIVPNW